MIRTLLRKELVEHGIVLAVVFAATFFGFLLVLANMMIREAGSALESVRIFGVSFYILTCLVVCNRLVVHEYSGKTQLFLEGLPLSRSVMLWTKYLLGIGIVTLVIGSGFALALALASRQEPISPRFLVIMISRLAAFIFCTYSFFFMMGLQGRYRIPIYVCLFLAMIILTESTAMDLTQQGPFALLDDEFAFERFEFPVRDLVTSAMAGCVFTLIAMLMGLVREGSVASLLAERMSQREKLFVTVAIVMLLFTGTLIDQKKTPDPYEMFDAATESGNGVTVHVETMRDSESGSRIAKQMHEDLLSIRDYLEIDEVPEVFLVNRRDLDADRYEPAKLKNASGILIRANYGSSEWSYNSFQPFLIDVSISRISHFNAIHEPQCWVLEGFSEYWPRRRESNTNWNDESFVDRRAAYGALLGITEQDIGDWYLYRDRVGDAIARSVACSGLVFAERKYGSERLRDFLQQVLRLDQPKDFRADLNRWRHPISKVWERTMGSDYQQFIRDWNTELKTLEQSFAKQIREIPRLTADVAWIKRSQVTYEMQVTPRCSSENAINDVSVKYEEISVFDDWRTDRRAKSQTESFDPNDSITITDTFAAGGRVRWTTSVYAPELQCDVISGWQRQEVK